MKYVYAIPLALGLVCFAGCSTTPDPVREATYSIARDLEINQRNWVRALSDALAELKELRERYREAQSRTIQERLQFQASQDGHPGYVKLDEYDEERRRVQDVIDKEAADLEAFYGETIALLSGQIDRIQSRLAAVTAWQNSDYVSEQDIDNLFGSMERLGTAAVGGIAEYRAAQPPDEPDALDRMLDRTGGYISDRLDQFDPAAAETATREQLQTWITQLREILNSRDWARPVQEPTP